MSREIKWLDEPEPHDYQAALSVLSLPYSLEHAGLLVHSLRAAPVEEWKAKDIVRMADEIILDRHNSHVQHNFKKIREGKALSPILLVRTEHGLLIADGFHRACSVYLFDEDQPVKAKIAGEGV
ncbi:hypothetical protein M3I54_22515 [Paraburkholderia sp. CNPSo 3274]|uniref:hypothetical protein n=1 Tax=Paraburkholderia sp. CNPSo 3274 TaxID=2940932 RepID=UPI0020B894CC|nr:hypothetical protein [Paraburkholderia sp. CNPSo 3274]MCP3709720.1 hypothetical protein [Paraburkholderia sp. CNPSo 3274]